MNELIRRLNKKKIVIVDLRQEFHWFVYDNGQWMPFCLFEPHFFYNQGKSQERIVEEEKQMCQSINKKPCIEIFHMYQKANHHRAERSYRRSLKATLNPFCLTEEQLIEKYFSESCVYYRVPIQDHYAPGEQVFKRLQDIVKKHPCNWIHIHCRGGSGRTSLVLLLLDILKHKNRFTFKEYIERQIKRGGADLLKEKYKERLMHVQRLTGF